MIFSSMPNRFLFQFLNLILFSILVQMMDPTVFLQSYQRVDWVEHFSRSRDTWW